MFYGHIVTGSIALSFDREQPNLNQTYFSSDPHSSLNLNNLNIASASTINVTSTAEMSLHTIKAGLLLFYPMILNTINALKNS